MSSCVSLIDDIIVIILLQKEETALHIASRRGDHNIVSVLIGAKAGIDLQDKVL